MLKNAAFRCLKWLGFSIATLIVIFAVLISAARAIVPLLNDKRVFFEKWASHAFHQSVHIGHVTMDWRGFDPTLRFNDVTVRDPKHAQSLLRVNHFLVSLDLLQSFIHWKLLPRHISLSGTHVDIYQNQKGQLHVKGVVDLHGKEKHADLGYMSDILMWMLTQSDISLQHINVDLHLADGRLLPIKNLRLNVMNSVMHHQIAGVASLAQTIPTRFRFVMNLHSTKIDKSHFNADLYFRANHLVLRQWVDNRYLRKYFKNVKITHGVTNVKSWLKWRRGHLTEYQGVLRSDNMGLSLAAKHKKVLMNHVGANVYWQRLSDGWSLTADRVNLRMHGKTWPEHAFGIRLFKKTQSTPQKIIFASHFARLHDIKALSEDFGYWPESTQKMYKRLKPHGNLRNLYLVMALQGDKLLVNRIRTEFQHLSFSSCKQLPAASGLNGFIDATPSIGTLKVRSNHAAIGTSQLFHHPLLFKQLNIKAGWQHTASGWNVNLSRLSFNNNVGLVRAKGSLTIPKLGSPIINMKTTFKNIDVAFLKNYVPSDLHSKKLERWLKSAFLSGKIPSASMKLQGPVRNFPFNDKSGRFNVCATIKNLDFKYAAEWPAINHINGQVIFDNQSMRVSVKQGSTVGNPLSRVRAEIPDLRKPILTVTGYSTSDLKRGELFLQKSPLKVGHQLYKTRLSGPMQLNLRLDIPLFHARSQKNKHRVIAHGDVAVDNGVAKLTAWNTEFNHIKGTFHFADSDLTATHVTALHYGLPTVIDVATLHATTQPLLQIQVGGQMSMASFEKQLKLPVLQFMQGKTAYRALVKIRDVSSVDGSSLNLMTDLNGIHVSLPPPYNKKATETRPLFLSMQTVRNKPLEFKLNYGKNFSAAASFTNSGNNLKFISGQIHLGSGQAQFQKSSGLSVDGNLKKVVWSKWKKYLNPYIKSKTPSSKTKIPQMAHIKNINLQINQLLVFDHVLHNVNLDLSPKAGGWSVTLKSPIIDGNVFMPSDYHQRWYGHFSHLYLPKLKIDNKKGQQQIIDPHKLPPFNFSSDDFHYGDKALGKVHIETAVTQTGLKINQLTVNNKLFGLSAVGTWQDQQGHLQSTLFGEFGSNNLGKLLKNWGITTVLEGGAGSANFAFAWQGAPYKFDAAKLNGSVKVDFRNGRVSQVTKNAESELGFGRLLNLFSLQTLPLLPIKLVHLTKKGFAFDLLKGNFKLNHGTAVTNDASIVGSVAWVQVHGDIGFGSKSYNLNLNIVPNITSSLPLIVGIAGGPLAGAITWVANKILAPQVGKAAQINYRVTGSWAKPIITKIPKPAETHMRGA